MSRVSLKTIINNENALVVSLIGDDGFFSETSNAHYNAGRIMSAKVMDYPILIVTDSIDRIKDSGIDFEYVLVIPFKGVNDLKSLTVSDNHTLAVIAYGNANDIDYVGVIVEGIKFFMVADFNDFNMVYVNETVGIVASSDCDILFTINCNHDVINAFNRYNNINILSYDSM